MKAMIRDVGPADLPALLELNDAAVPHVNSIDLEQMQWFCRHSMYFRVAEENAAIVAFLIGLAPGIDYQSPNYQWFCRHYPRFVYVDRIVVADTARKSGLATRLYDDFAATAPGDVPVMTCEVNIRPANETSMRFHLRRGFRQIGSQATDAGNKQVALLEKKL